MAPKTILLKWGGVLVALTKTALKVGVDGLKKSGVLCPLNRITLRSVMNCNYRSPLWYWKVGCDHSCIKATTSGKVKRQSTAYVLLSVYAPWLQTHRQTLLTGNNSYCSLLHSAKPRSYVKRFKQESSDKHIHKHKHKHTNKRMLPSALSPCFALLSMLLHFHMLL